MYESLSPSHSPRVAIVGKSKNTVNYENALKNAGAICLTTMDLGRLPEFDALLLPGGGDITPAFFGQKNQGSRNIDIELDITQLQALDLFVKRQCPVLGICKGMQIINVFFGGTIIQHIKESVSHAWDNDDKIHPTTALPDSYLTHLYGEHFSTNSAHHQALGALGRDLCIIQTADDGVIEGIVHNTLPILGVQWHPERVPSHIINGEYLFSYFLSLCSFSGI